MILVDFDMPKNCRECPIMGCIYHSVNDTRPDLCPIVREVKRGRWITEKRSMTIYPHRCSECGASQRAKYDYCPSCGADNREDSE